jgi:uncharacterized protein GlcG (DUF336 family)
MSMKLQIRMLLIVVVACVLTAPLSAFAEVLTTHRIPAALAVEAVMETIAFCAKSGYEETAVVVDFDGVRQAEVRGDGAGIYTLDSAYHKAYTAVAFKRDSSISAQLAQAPGGLAVLSKLPNLMFFPGGVVVKIDDEVVGAIGASGAPNSKLDEECARAGLDKIRDRLK